MSKKKYILFALITLIILTGIAIVFYLRGSGTQMNDSDFKLLANTFRTSYYLEEQIDFSIKNLSQYSEIVQISVEKKSERSKWSTVRDYVRCPCSGFCNLPNTKLEAAENKHFAWDQIGNDCQPVPVGNYRLKIEYCDAVDCKKTASLNTNSFEIIDNQEPIASISQPDFRQGDSLSVSFTGQLNYIIGSVELLRRSEPSEIFVFSDAGFLPNSQSLVCEGATCYFSCIDEPLQLYSGLELSQEIVLSSTAINCVDDQSQEAVIPAGEYQLKINLWRKIEDGTFEKISIGTEIFNINE